MPVKDVNGITILAKDEHMRPATTMQSLGQLNASFVQMGEMGGFDAVAMQRYPDVEAIKHVHHAGNSSGIVDGAAAVLIGNKKAGKRAGLKPRARVKAFANIGSEPGIMLTGPIAVTEKVLKRAGMTRDDIDLFELNEAFAAVVLRYMQAFGIDARQDQRQRRRDRDGPSARRDRRDDPRHRARRAGAARPQHRAGDAVHRRRHGHRDDHRAGVSLMTYQNFKLDLDEAGIALVTWDMPGKSMNVIDQKVIEELGAIVEKVATDPTIKGAVVTSGKETFSGGADLTMLEQFAQMADALSRSQDEAAAAGVPRDRRAASRSSIAGWRRAESRGSRRSTARRSAGPLSFASPAITASPRIIRRRAWACPRSRSGCSPAPAAPRALRG